MTEMNKHLLRSSSILLDCMHDENHRTGPMQCTHPDIDRSVGARNGKGDYNKVKDMVYAERTSNMKKGHGISERT